MKLKEKTEKLIAEITENKETLRENFQKKPNKISEFYNSIKGLGINELKQIFPAPKAVVEKNIFDATTEIIADTPVKKKALAIISLAKPKSLEKTDSENFKKDQQLLQGIFFFLIREICEKGFFFATDEQKSEIAELFDSALKENSWFLPEKQCEILNKISKKLRFLKENPFNEIDFTKFEGNYFKANESILRILANFSAKSCENVPREKIINVVNFVREFQKKILPVFPNTKKSDYSDSTANEEITKAKNNLKSLKVLDFGFVDPDFSQTFFAEDEKLKNTFSRKITFKFFQESEMRWKDGDPRKKNDYHRKELKILARKNDRFTNKAALHTKFLYPERNMVTHISDSFAVHNLFKEYMDFQISYWKTLILYAFFDSYKYLCKLKREPAQKENAEKLLSILEHCFRKITATLGLNEASREELWQRIFDFDKENGDLRLNSKELDKINIYNEEFLDEDQITYFKKFMNFLYCSENEAEDLFEKHSFAIQIYLIYLTFELAKMDKITEKHQ